MTRVMNLLSAVAAVFYLYSAMVFIKSKVQFNSSEYDNNLTDVQKHVTSTPRKDVTNTFIIPAEVSNTCSVYKISIQTSIHQVMYPTISSQVLQYIGMSFKEHKRLLIDLGLYVECYLEPYVSTTPMMDTEIVIEADGICDKELKELMYSISMKNGIFGIVGRWLECRDEEIYIKRKNDTNNAIITQLLNSYND